ncbi:putative ATPase PAAT [Helianthus annuus]|nr:putative ATPase PAAT [Helianthus annuus]
MTTPWTSWTVSRGSLDSVLTFETFDFPIESESTPRKPPLLLLPPSSDSQPCEIKLNFTQKHEIRQVYVRSTARVYEIYYAPALHSDNEYLCTVRCSAASVEDNSFPASDVKEAISVNSEGHTDILSKARVAGENKIGTNEDDWVEVKLPVGLEQSSNNSRNHQDFYEATAEINDSEPCMSLTIRLLSLQTKGCIYVDEVYVFADPIDSDDSENQTVNAETSANNSLMTMLVPTLLGLTKSRSAQLHDQNSSNPVGPATSNYPVNHVYQQDETSCKPSEAKAELTQSQLAVSTPNEDKVSDWTARNELSYNRSEILLEQLVERVSRIEDICMRFEENMLKPINNMEARLQRVEQQVELLVRCPVSPSFSRLEPEPRSISNDGNGSKSCGEPELEKTESFLTGTHNPPEDKSMATDEKLEVNDVLESPKKEKPKKTVSIDDALAAALAGFSSFSKPNDSCIVESIDTTRVSNTDGEEEASISSESLKATAPEFMGEDNDEGPTSCDVSTDITDNSFDSHGTTSQVDDEEAMGPTGNVSCPSSPPHETNAQLESITAVKVLTFDKTDILKHFPDQPQDVPESRVDFESPILEVKFASFDNGSLKSPLEALLTDDAARPAIDEGMLIEERSKTANNLLVDLDGDDAAKSATNEGVLIEECSKTTNTLLVDLDGDDAARPAIVEGGVLIEELPETATNILGDLDGDGVCEKVHQQDLPLVQLETSFASLI